MKRLQKILLCTAGAALLLVGAIVVMRSTIGWVYPVGSGSMEPWISTGDWVYVSFDSDELDRYECVVFADVGGGASVKRALGLPTESFRIDGAGDVRINGVLLSIDDPGRPEPIPVFDSTLASLEPAWQHGTEAFDPWERMTDPGPNEEWRLDGSSVGRGAELGLLRFQERIDDGYLGPDGVLHHGTYVVHDVIVEFEAKIERMGGILQVQLTEQGDIFDAYIPVYPGTAQHTAYLRRALADKALHPIDGKQPPRLLSQAAVPVPVGEWIQIRFANVDNCLTLEMAGQKVAFDYDKGRNTPHWNSPDGEPYSTGPRVALGATGLEMRVRNIRVLRDFHYVPRGEFGVNGELTLKDNEIFVLGDSSAISRDSRDRGPVSLDRLIGKARSVVWPSKHQRDL